MLRKMRLKQKNASLMKKERVCRLLLNGYIFLVFVKVFNLLSIINVLVISEIGLNIMELQGTGMQEKV